MAILNRMDCLVCRIKQKYILLKAQNYTMLYVLFKTEEKATDLIKYKHKTFVDY